MRVATFVLVAMCGLATGAQTDVLTLSTPIVTLPGDLGEVFNLQPFDARLGTLTAPAWMSNSAFRGAPNAGAATRCCC